MERNPKFEGKGVSVELKGVKLFYAKLTPDNVDNYEGKLRYKVTVLLDKALGQKFEDAGMNVKTTEDGDKIIDCFSNVKYKDGNERKPPIVVFEDGRVYDPAVDGFIGNETVANVDVIIKYVKVGKNYHLPLYLNKVTIIDFIPYGAPKEDVEDIF